MSKRNKFLIIAVFLLSLFWQLFFTWGIGFFWEDIDIFHLYQKDSVVLQHLSDKYNIKYSVNIPLPFSIGLNIAKEFLKKYFVLGRLFKIGFDPYSVIDRPYEIFMWDLMRLFFGNCPIGYTLFNALFFALSCVLIFYTLSNLSAFFALLGTLIFATSSELWLGTINKNHYGVFALFNTFIAVIFFIKLIERKRINYLIICCYYFFIITASNFACLTLVDGRYLAVIFFLTLILFQREKLRFHIPMLLILFMMEFPILGYVKKIFFDYLFSPIDFSTHLGTNISTLQTLKTALSNYKFVRNALGSFLIVILYISVSINICYLFLRKNNLIFKQQLFSDIYIKRRIFLFFLWFVSALFMVARARGFAYSGAMSFQIIDLIYFISPFILFLMNYCLSISRTLQKPYSLIVLAICIGLILVQIFHNNVRLNKFRRSWGNYLCAWQNAGKFVDNNSKRALTLAFMHNHYKPFFFYNLDNKVITTTDSCLQSQFCDNKFIEDKFKEGFNDIFVVAEQNLNFRNYSERVNLVSVTPIDGNSGDLHDYIKIKFGYSPKVAIYIYHFKPNK